MHTGSPHAERRACGTGTGIFQLLGLGLSDGSHQVITRMVAPSLDQVLPVHEQIHKDRVDPLWILAEIGIENAD